MSKATPSAKSNGSQRKPEAKQSSKGGTKAQSDGKPKEEPAGGYSEAERREQSSKAAQSSLAAQKKAKELKEAAMGAGDPDERQKLLNQAIDHEIEAEKLGKTAKYLQSGTFQGLVAGGGLGTGVGVGLGTLTGTLVGGLTSTVTGGLGAALGSGVGALHGPWFKMGDVAGGAIRKVTGDLPGWKATEGQKKTLEKMMGQIDEQDMPSTDDLSNMSSGKFDTSAATSSGADGAKAAQQGSKNARTGSDNEAGSRPKKAPRKLNREEGKKMQEASGHSVQSGKSQTQPQAKPDKAANGTQTTPSTPRSAKKPQKLEVRSDQKPAKKSPKKLEVRARG